MTAKKKSAPKSDPLPGTLPTTRYRRKDQAVDVIESAAILDYTGETYPDGVTLSDEGVLFQGRLIEEDSFLLFDELGTPLELYTADAFKEQFELDAGARGNDALKGDLAEAHTMIKKLEDRVLEQDALIDDLRKNGTPLSTDSALEVLRAIMRIEPAQLRDDGGRIIHLNRKVLDRAIALL